MSLIQLLDTVLGTVATLVVPAGDAQIAALAAAQEAAGETIEVTSDAPAESASSVHLGAEQLRYRSRTQPSDVLRQIPGLVVAQHAGGGKSDQYFIRGFDADHGTDVAIFADGVPVNLVSHGHGQGYADTHWMIPETIASVDMHKGPYAARYGDFATAAALELTTIDRIASDGAVWIAAGSPLGQRGDRFDRRLVGMASPRLRDGDRTLLALQVGEADGPFDHPQGFRSGNALGKWSGALGPGTLQLETTWYRGTWHQSGQLPEREITAGRLDRFGSLDPTEGGAATRASLQARYATAHLRVLGYAVRNRLDLFSNFTLFARDPVDGDQIEQTDDRWLYGATAAYERALGGKALVTAGAQLRADDVATSLWHTTQRMRLGEATDHTRDAIVDAAAYAEGKLFVTDALRLMPGVRVDRLAWRVRDLGAPELPAAGSAAATVASPKLSLEYAPERFLSLFANTGAGFHSNDARAAVAGDGTGAVARALGAEGGFRMRPADRARVSADVWYLHLASEQVWSGDEGGTEPAGATRRFGLDLEGSIDATPWLSLDANVTWAHATFVANAGNGGALALAPRWMGSGGVTVHDETFGFVAVRARGIGDRPGNDDGTLTAEGYLIVDVTAGRRIGSADLGVTINNALDADWREAQFATRSRVTPTAPIVEQMHYTPGVPLTVTATAAMTF